MDIFYTYPLYALIVSNAVLIFGAAIALIRFERLVKRSRTFWESPTGASVQTVKTTATVRSIANSQDVLAGFLERRLAMLNDRLDDMTQQKQTSVAAPATELPFGYAMRIARNGASVEDLIRTCGLNKAEAHLMRRLYAQQRTAQPSPAR